MKNRGLVQFFAIALCIVTIYQLSFTFVALRVEKKARNYANGDRKQEKAFLDSMSNETVYNLGVKKWTYLQCKERQLNLGLDLQGGMSVTLEVSTPEVLKALSGNNKDKNFNEALEEARIMQTNSQRDYVDLFLEAYQKRVPNASLAPLFATIDNKDIKSNSSNEEVISFIKKQTSDAFNASFKILRTRIDRFGVTQPVIQQLQNGRILVELPGVDDPERVRKLIQQSAKLEFWQVYQNYDAYKYLEEANKVAGRILNSADSVKIKGVDTTTAESLEAITPIAAVETDSNKIVAAADSNKKVDSIAKVASDTAGDANQTPEEYARKNPIFAYLQFNASEGRWQPSGVIAMTNAMGRTKIDNYLSLDEVKAKLPANLLFAWSSPEKSDDGQVYYSLYALKAGADGRPALEGDVVVDARPDVSSQNANDWEISMSMNAEGAMIWKRVTKEAASTTPHKAIAIVLDGMVYSAPTVTNEIPNGQSNITGKFTYEEAQDLANILKSGKMPAPARIVEEAIVGPSLGAESINQGWISIIAGFIVVILFMYLVYNTSGWIADIAVLANLFFLIGVLASFSAALTLPGIAGIILSLGMAVDANVLVNERVKEELAMGRGLKMAIDNGYKNAFSAIIDSNVTTLLAGFVLLAFGSGPVFGFAVTLIIGIICSLFTAVLLTRLFFTRQIEKGKNISFSHNYSKSILRNTKFDFMGKRKIFYIISSIIILAGLVSMFTKKEPFSLGVDFRGGWSYVVEFDQSVKTPDIRAALTETLKGAPEVKSYGADNKASITTSYNINDLSDTASKEVVRTLSNGLNKAGYNNFKFVSEKKVGPTIADDIQKDAVWAILVALIGMFIYILIRFQRIQFAIGAVISLFHDVLIVLSLYTLLKDVMPFSMDIDQAFVAAILTVIGYSINDSVVVFDRVREFLADSKDNDEGKVINAALNDTLSRTLITGMTTIFVLIILFVFGGQALKSFSFAMLVGVIVGTYSSLCIGTPVVLDLTAKKKIA